jgi:hypothetical protein
LLEKEKGSRLYIRCQTFNTQANRVVIACSAITKIFISLQVSDSHISTFLNTLVFNFVLVNNCSLPVNYGSTFVRLLFTSCSVIHI